MTVKKTRQIHLDPAEATILQVQEKMKEAVRDGSSVLCPCCKQMVTLVERPISDAMAKALIILYRHFSEGSPEPSSDWVHVPTLILGANKLGAGVRGSDWAKLPHWGLLEEKPEKPGDKEKRAGFCRMLPKGRQFVLGETKLPKTIRLYNGRFMGYGSGQASIKECLDEGSDYDKLMAGDYGVFIL